MEFLGHFWFSGSGFKNGLALPFCSFVSIMPLKLKHSMSIICILQRELQWNKLFLFFSDRQGSVCQTLLLQCSVLWYLVAQSPKDERHCIFRRRASKIKILFWTKCLSSGFTAFCDMRADIPKHSACKVSCNESW